MVSRNAPDGELVLPQSSLVDHVLARSRHRGPAAVRALLATALVIAVSTSGGAPSAPGQVVLVVAEIYVVISTVRLWRTPSTKVHARADLGRALLDVIVVAAIACTVQEPRGVVLLLLCAIPLGRSLTLSAAAVAAITAGTVSAVLAIWASGVLFDAYGLSDGALLLVAFALGWCGLVACLIAVERERRSIRISELSGSVQEMLRQAIRAEETERQRVADLLHDDVLQILLTARHDIADAMDGDLDLLPDARNGLEAATRRLRETIGGLRTDGIAAHNLGDGVRLLAAQSADRRSFDVDVDVEPTLDGIHHPLLLSVVRDLLRDAEQTSAPTRLSLRLYEAPGLLILVMRHDDRRFALGLDVSSDEDGELLEAVDHRVRAVAGTFAVERSADDGHRNLHVVIPVYPPDEPGPEGPPRSTALLGAGVLRGALPRTEPS